MSFTNKNNLCESFFTTIAEEGLLLSWPHHKKRAKCHAHLTAIRSPASQTGARDLAEIK